VKKKPFIVFPSRRWSQALVREKPGCPIYWKKLWYFRLEQGWIFIRYHFHCILERDDTNCKTQLKAIILMISFKYLTTPISVEIFIAAESILVEKAIYIHILQFRVILIKSNDVRFSYTVYLTKQHQPLYWICEMQKIMIGLKNWIYYICADEQWVIFFYFPTAVNPCDHILKIKIPLTSWYSTNHINQVQGFNQIYYQNTKFDISRLGFLWTSYNVSLKEELKWWRRASCSPKKDHNIPIPFLLNVF